VGDSSAMTGTAAPTLPTPSVIFPAQRGEGGHGPRVSRPCIYKEKISVTDVHDLLQNA